MSEADTVVASIIDKDAHLIERVHLLVNLV